MIPEVSKLAHESKRWVPLDLEAPVVRDQLEEIRMGDPEIIKFEMRHGVCPFIGKRNNQGHMIT